MYDVQAVIVFTGTDETDAARLSDVSTVTIAQPNKSLALPLTGKRPKQQQSRQALQRQHVFHTYQVPATSGSAPTSLGRKRLLSYTTMNAAVSVDTFYDLRLGQPNKKKGKTEAREARRFLRWYIKSVEG